VTCSAWRAIALAPAERDGLVVLDVGRLVLRHPLVRSVAYHGATPQERRTAHGAVATALPVGDPRRAWHLAAASAEPSEPVALEPDAAAAARARGGPGPAGRLQRRAGDLTPDRRRRARRLLAAAADFDPAGQPDEARRALDDAERLVDDPVLLARIRGTRAQVLLRSGHPAAARGPLVHEAAELAGTDGPAAARLLLDAALAGMLLGELESWREDARSALALLPGEDEPLRPLAVAMLATALIGAGRSAEAEPLLAGIDFGAPAATGAAMAGTADVLALLAHALVWIDRWAEAERLVDRLIDRARSSSAVSALSYALGVKAALDARRGRWAAAAAGAHEGVALAAAAGSESHVAGTSGAAALVAAWQGRAEDCEAHARRSLALAGRSAPRLAVWPEHALGELALARGDIEAAVGHLERAAAVHDAAGLVEPGSRPWQPSLIEALVRLGETARAERLLEAWERAAAATGRRFARATAGRCRGLLCEEDAVDACFAAALAAARGAGDLPPPRRRGLVGAHPSGAPCDGRHGAERHSLRGGRAHAARAPGGPDGGRGPHEPRGGRGDVPRAQDHRAPPQHDLPQARAATPDGARAAARGRARPGCGGVAGARCAAHRERGSRRR
jgi:tetratricopeptide (TPR) repeat protein